MKTLHRRSQSRVAFALAAVFSLGGCATMHPRDFTGSKTKFELDRYFTGHARSFGVFENGGAAPKKTFVADNMGVRQPDGTVVLTQHFQFSDGTKQKRVWRIRRIDDTHWDATANDMVGIAHGVGEGNALYWEYDITTNPKNPFATVHVSQWIYQPDGTDTVMTRLRISKMGVKLFEVTESIHPIAD